MTTSLLFAVRYLHPPLRGNSISVSLWVDAVCIDQGNRGERSQQVSLMRDIYGLAEGVWIWFGEEGDGSDAMFDGSTCHCGPNSWP